MADIFIRFSTFWRRDKGLIVHIVCIFVRYSGLMDFFVISVSDVTEQVGRDRREDCRRVGPRDWKSLGRNESR